MSPKRGVTLEPKDTTVLLRVSRMTLVVVGSARDDDRGKEARVEPLTGGKLLELLTKVKPDTRKVIVEGFEELDDRAADVVGHG